MGWLSRKIEGQWGSREDEELIREKYGEHKIHNYFKGVENKRGIDTNYSLWVVLTAQKEGVSLIEIEVSRDDKECAWKSRLITKENMHEAPIRARQMYKKERDREVYNTQGMFEW